MPTNKNFISFALLNYIISNKNIRMLSFGYINNLLWIIFKLYLITIFYK